MGFVQTRKIWTMTYKNRFFILFFTFISVLLTACSSGVAVQPANISGQWNLSTTTTIVGETSTDSGPVEIIQSGSTFEMGDVNGTVSGSSVKISDVFSNAESHMTLEMNGNVFGNAMNLSGGGVFTYQGQEYDFTMTMDFSRTTAQLQNLDSATVLENNASTEVKTQLLKLMLK